ncbi:unnamed protein product [Citrullus colocynthis]|uniref:Uncharacterized protein n=1 Tax=Citrullus colocynthis TaxID=252529 RepID=A0ABP0YJF5_9ROSI
MVISSQSSFPLRIKTDGSPTTRWLMNTSKMQERPRCNSRTKREVYATLNLINAVLAPSPRLELKAHAFLYLRHLKVVANMLQDLFSFKIIHGDSAGSNGSSQQLFKHRVKLLGSSESPRRWENF